MCFYRFSHIATVQPLNVTVNISRSPYDHKIFDYVFDKQINLRH